ncbi:hypothetical protein R84B8_01606 [Treponema sp. R8-4-B8]
MVSLIRPFTPVSGAVLVIAIAGLIRSLLNRNSYEIVLASFALLFLLILGFFGAWKSRKLKSMEPGWKPPFPMTANAADDERQRMTESHTAVTGLDAAIPLFFRLHFYIRGKFFPGGATGVKKGCHLSLETAIPRGETTAQIPFDFPMSGVFQGDGFCKLRDIFGFFAFPCGQIRHSTVNVRCAPCFGKKIAINAQSGAEDQRNKPSADVERYYQREYTPGDRLRDINWKSSDKIDALITRISTDNQEKVSRIEVHFRNFGYADNNLQSLWLLDRSKARLSYFLRSLLEQNSSFIFDVHSAGKNWEIEDQDDLDAFFEELACLSFVSPQNETALQSGAGDMYVFSTACDLMLSSFLLSCNPRPVTLFLTQPGDSTANYAEKKRTSSKDLSDSLIKKTKTNEDNFEVLHIQDFVSKGFFPPSRWFMKQKVKPLNIQAEKIEMFYAEIKI